MLRAGRNNHLMNYFWQNSVCFFLALTLSGCGFLEWPARPRPLSQYGSKALENIEKNIISTRQVLTVRAALGDTVYKLSRRHGVSVRNIIDKGVTRARTKFSTYYLVRTRVSAPSVL